MHRIFVYGTLKQGFCRHDSIADQAYLGLAKTEPNYKLFDLGTYPGMITVAEEGMSIEGELYSVDDDCLTRLDQVEGVEDGYYVREAVQLLSPWNTELVQTYIYLLPLDGCAEISHWSSK